MIYWISILFASCIENQRVTVRGNSMAPGLVNNQEIVVAKNFYNCNRVKPSANDVVSFKHLDKEYLKRIVAVEKDILKFENDFLIINDKKTKIKLTAKEQKLLSLYSPVPKESVIVLGDNLQESKDSRNFGPIPISSIIGRVP